MPPPTSVYCRRLSPLPSPWRCRQARWAAGTPLCPPAHPRRRLRPNTMNTGGRGGDIQDGYPHYGNEGGLQADYLCLQRLILAYGGVPQLTRPMGELTRLMGELTPLWNAYQLAYEGAYNFLCNGPRTPVERHPKTPSERGRFTDGAAFTQAGGSMDMSFAAW